MTGKTNFQVKVQNNNEYEMQSMHVCMYVWFLKCKVSAGNSKWRLVYEHVSVDSVSWYSLLRQPCVIAYIIHAVITILSLACIFI